MIAVPQNQQAIDVKQPEAPGDQSGVVLQAWTQSSSPRELEIRLKIENRTSGDVFVFDRPWTLDRAGKPVLDPEKCYRFVLKQKLRILLGPAPLPRLKTVAFRNVPYGSRVRAGEAVQVSFPLCFPVKEYNFYFPEIEPDKYEPSKVGQLEMVVQFVRLQQPGLTRPAAAGPSALELTSAALLDHLETATLSLNNQNLEVLRRTDEFDRLALAGEQPEALKLAP